MSNNSNQVDLVLVDGMALIYAAYHAMPSLTATSGMPTGAIKGFDNTIKQLRKRLISKQFIVIFDAKGKTFRHEKYAEYKANRKPMPDDLSVQIKPIQDLVAMLGIPVIIEKGVEADDVIGTLASQASQQKLTTTIVTPDKDMVQLIDEYVQVYNPRQDTWLNATSVQKKYGISVNQFIDYLSLIGDASDNIKGVDKVGPKTACNWLQKFNDIDNLLANAHTINTMAGKNLAVSKDILEKAKDLVTIKLDLDISLANYQLQAVNTVALDEFYVEMNFIKQQKTNVVIDIQTTILTKVDSLSKLKTEAIKAKNFAVYLLQENTTTSSILGAAIYINSLTAFYLPLATTNALGIADQTESNISLTDLTELLYYLWNKVDKCVHNNAKNNYRLLNKHIASNHKMADVMLESYAIDANSSHTLEAIVKKYLQTNLPDAPNFVAGKKKQALSTFPTQQLANFALSNAQFIMDIHNKFTTILASDSDNTKLLADIEMPLVSILLDIELTGALLDCDKLIKYSAEIAKKLTQLEQDIFVFAEDPFNINSPKQVQYFLFDTLKLSSPKKTSGGSASTSEAVLQQIADQHEAVGLISQYRSWAKLKTTYTDKLPLMVDSHNRIHTTLNQAVVVTGRLSSSNPNLQNIPIRTEASSFIRSAFIAPTGYKIVSADYSQIELRLIAHLANDADMIADFKAGIDIHTATAAKVFAIDIDAVTTQQRRDAKAINFGLIYGISSFGLANQLKVSRAVAQEFIDAYFKRYPAILEYMQSSKAKASQQQFVQTVAGRKLIIHNINDKNSFIRAAADRLAINAPIQGSAADIIKIAMIKVANWIKTEQIDATMVLQVHDELIFEVKTEIADIFCKQVATIMEQVVDLKVDLIVDVSAGDNWQQAH